MLPSDLRSSQGKLRLAVELLVLPFELAEELLAASDITEWGLFFSGSFLFRRSIVKVSPPSEI